MLPETTRLLWLLDQAPFEMYMRLRFTDKSDYGTIQWTDALGHSRLRRFTSGNIEDVVRDVTISIMEMVYTDLRLLPDEIDEPIVISYGWNGQDIGAFFKGFKNKRAMNAWLKNHQGWLQFKQL